jgi:hypothetical protein
MLLALSVTLAVQYVDRDFSYVKALVLLLLYLVLCKHATKGQIS